VPSHTTVLRASAVLLTVLSMLLAAWPAGAHTVTVKLFRVGTLIGESADWVSGVQVALRAENYASEGYRDTDWDGERTLRIADDAVNAYFQWYKIGCDGGAARYDMAAHDGTVYIPIDCPQHSLTIRVYDEESWNGRTGRLLPGVAMRVDSPRYPYYFRTVDVETDDNGETRLVLPPGDFQVELSKTDCVPATTMLRNVTADRVEPLFINCSAATIRGHDEPVESATPLIH